MPQEDFQTLIGQISFPSARMSQENIGISADARAAEIALLALSALERKGVQIRPREYKLLKISLASLYTEGDLVEGEWTRHEMVEDFMENVKAVLDKEYGQDKPR